MTMGHWKLVMILCAKIIKKELEEVINLKTYSDGKLNETDEGDLKIAIYSKDGKVIINFGKDLSWLGFDKKSLRLFIDGLEKQYKKI